MIDLGLSPQHNFCQWESAQGLFGEKRAGSFSLLHRLPGVTIPGFIHPSKLSVRKCCCQTFTVIGAAKTALAYIARSMCTLGSGTAELAGMQTFHLTRRG